MSGPGLVKQRGLLQEAERYLRGLLGTSEGFIAFLQPDGTVSEVSQTVLRLSGLRDEDVLGQPLWAVPCWSASETGSARVRESVAQAGRGDEARLVAEVLGTEGTAATIDLALRPVHNEAGAVTLLIAEGQDVTQYKALKRHALYHDHVLHLFAEHAPVAVAIFDREMHYLVASRRWLADYGLVGQDLIGRSHYEVFPEIPDHWKQIHQRCLRGEVERCEEEAFSRADGAVQWLRWEVRPWCAAHGAVGGLVLLTEDITERKQEEEALKEREAQYRLLAENMQDLVCLHAPDGTYEWVSPSASALLGYEPEELLGRTPYDFFHKEEAGRIRRESHEKLLRREQPETFMAYRIRHREGHYVWLETASKAILDEEGAVIGLQTTSRDITERKQAEDALRQQEERMRLLYQVTTQATRDPDEQLDEALTLATRLFGFQMGIISEVDQASGTYTLRHVAAPDGALERGQQFPLGQTYCSITLGAPGATAIEHRGCSPHRRHPCHEAFGLKSCVGVALQVDGQCYGTLHFSRPEPRPEPLTREDLALIELLGRWVAATLEQKRAQQALRESKARYASVLTAMAEGIVLQDAQGEILTCNPAAEQILGLTVEEMAGRRSADPRWRAVREDLTPFPAEDHPTMRTLRTGKPVEGVVMGVRRPEGTLRWTSINTQPLFHEGDAAPYAVVATFVDVTERKRVDEMKNEFVSVVSHELRTPLTSIAGSLRLASSGVVGAVPEKVQQMLTIAHRNSERLVRLINDLLDIQKMEAGKLTLELQARSLHLLLQQALADIASYDPERAVQFHCTGDTSGVHVQVDPDRILQVLANLLSNAVKFSPPGGKVGVAVEREQDAVRILVADEGPGIPEEARATLFDKFTQADSSTSRGRQGTGLGLAITRQIVELHGGTIGFETEVGAGTTFFFTLPAVPSPAVSEPANEAKIPGGVRLLLCKDSEADVQLMSRVLGQEGICADVAPSVAEARRLAGQKTYDAVLLELIMPDGSAVSLIREWRTGEIAQYTPIIVVSAEANKARLRYAGQGEREAFDLKHLDWLQKPFSEDRLRQALRRMLSGAARPSLPVQAGTPRVLHVEDDEDSACITSHILKDLADLAHAATLEQARGLIQTSRFDAVILDMQLADGAGLELMPLLREGAPSVPVIAYSSQELDERATRDLKAALVKSRTSPEELFETLKRFIRLDPAQDA